MPHPDLSKVLARVADWLADTAHNLRDLTRGAKYDDVTIDCDEAIEQADTMEGLAAEIRAASAERRYTADEVRAWLLKRAQEVRAHRARRLAETGLVLKLQAGDELDGAAELFGRGEP
jgi:hypothetical protein